MLVLNLEKLFFNEGESIDLDQDLDLTELEIGGATPFTEPAHLRGALKNIASIVFVDAKLEADCHTLCDRCATEMTEHLVIPISHTLVTELNDEDDEDAYIEVGPDYELDVEALAVEELILNMPTKFLCREDCKGLCPTCGKNLNDGPCDCKKEIDPRLQALADMLNDTTED